MTRSVIITVVLIIAALILIPQAFYKVDETELAIVTRFGAFQSAETTPGLRAKTPFVDSVTKFDKRLLRTDAPAASLLTADKRNLIIDTYARYRIVDPLLFFQTLSSELQADSRVGNIVASSLRREVAQDLQTDIISDTREEIMRRVTEASNRTEIERAAALALTDGLRDVDAITESQLAILVSPLSPTGDIQRDRSATQQEIEALRASSVLPELPGAQINYFLPVRTVFGIEVFDVRIKRADFPPDIATSVFARMEAERERIASGLRAEGTQRDSEIRAEVDRRVNVTLETARGTAERTIGEGEREAIEILAEALERDPEFYDFRRTLEAYKTALATDTTVLLDSDSDLFKFLQDPFGNEN